MIIPVLTGNMLWGLLPACLAGYGGALFYWLFMVELPKHQEDTWPQYDDIWFEGQATRWGKDYVATDKI